MNETMDFIYDIWETVTISAAGCSCRIWGEITAVAKVLTVTGSPEKNSVNNTLSREK